MVAANDQILSSYHANQATSRRDEEEECIAYDDDDGSDEDGCIKTEDLMAAYGGGVGGGIQRDDDRGGKEKKQTFDRNAMMMLGNAIDYADRASSPYRKGNFDLLVLLATQESVHRVLRRYRMHDADERMVSFEWLRDFYVDRVGKYFDGNQPYGRADDFLEELLLVPPSMKTVGDTMELVDPMRIAEDIIRTRSEVGEDWKEIVASVPQEHTGLRKILLARQMGVGPGAGGDGGDAGTPLTADSALPSLKAEETTTTDFGTGAFD